MERPSIDWIKRATADWDKEAVFTVADCDFNRENYPDLIGNVYNETTNRPPSYAKLIVS